jgi:peptidoglycan/xylan/chitin deacetylase (PgdA/CDA1 family)
MNSIVGGSGILVISLDFELYWGLRDSRPLNSCRDRLIGARAAVPELLDLFRRYDVHATWATVGLLFFRNRADLLRGLPDQRPKYDNTKFSPYLDLQTIGLDENSDPYHYAPSLIRQILSCPNQEVATHTFSHYLCQEEGQDLLAFDADLAAAIAIGKEYGVRLESVVFPKNQCNSEYFEACERAGLRAYRGTQRSWLYRPRNSAGDEWPLRRIGRLLDAYINLTGFNYSLVSTLAGHKLINVAASRFLRPYSKRLRFLEPLKILRITDELRNAAKRGAVYHLYWHPHNFGMNLQENLSGLREVLNTFMQMRTQYGMRSLTMAEIAKELSAEQRIPTTGRQVGRSPEDNKHGCRDQEVQRI